MKLSRRTLRSFVFASQRFNVRAFGRQLVFCAGPQCRASIVRNGHLFLGSLVYWQSPSCLLIARFAMFSFQINDFNNACGSYVADSHGYVVATAVLCGN